MTDTEIEVEEELKVENDTESELENTLEEEEVDPIDYALELKAIIESILLTATKPLTPKQILAMLEEDSGVTVDQVNDALTELEHDFSERGVILKRIASGYEMQVQKRYARFVAKMWEERPPKYSRALFETLALITYKQPITRGEIEEIRGVSISTSIFKTLQDDRGWIRVVGHRDVPGRPALYATTKTFLDYFNVKGLEDLPSLPEIAKLTTSGDKVQDNLEMELEAEVEKQHEGQEEHPLQVASNEDSIEALDTEERTAELSEDIVDTKSSEENIDTDTVEDKNSMIEGIEETVDKFSEFEEVAIEAKPFKNPKKSKSKSKTISDGKSLSSLADKYTKK